VIFIFPASAMRSWGRIITSLSSRRQLRDRHGADRGSVLDAIAANPESHTGR
jgi:hypothetical protein